MNYQPGIIGIGTISSAGKNKKATLKTLLSGESRITPIKKLDIEDCNTSTAGQVDDSELEQSFYQTNLVDRSARYLTAAIEDALENYKIDLSEYNPFRIGLIVGTSLAGTELAEKFYKSYRNSKRGRIRTLIQYPLYTINDIVSRRFGIKGIKMIISTACSSGGTAIGYGADLIRSGHYDLIIAGGVDHLVYLSYGGFYSLKNMAENCCSPFSQGDIGLSLGEGAGILVLTSSELAKAKKINILAEVKGFAIGTDAYHPTAPEPQARGAVFAMKEAIKNANMNIEDIQYLNAHGTGTKLNDQIETRAVKKVFKDIANKIFISSSKSVIGHTLGAAGAMGAVFSAMAIENDFVPPTANFSENREGCDLNYVPNKAIRDFKVQNTISNSFAFGGNNVSIIIGKSGNRVNPINKKVDTPIFLTGCGVVSTLGYDFKEIYNRILLGEKAIFTENQPIEGFCRNTSSKSAYIRDFDIRKYGRYKNSRKMDRISQLAVAAGHLALKDAKIQVTPENDTEIGIIYSTGTGPIDSITRFYDGIIEKGIKNGDSSIFSNTVANAAGGYLGIETGIKGYSTTIASGYSSGLLSLMMSSDFLKNNYCKQVLAGCADEYSISLQSALIGLGVHVNQNLNEVILPMGADRTGIICGEAACFFTLESQHEASKAGRKAMGRIAGYGVASDCCAIGKNDPEGIGMKYAIDSAIASSGISKEEIGVVFSTARGHKLNDIAEGAGIFKALGRDVPVFFPAVFLGETFGSLALLATGLGFICAENGLIPSCGARYELSSEAPLNVVFDAPLKKNYNYFLVTASSFGGLNTAIIFEAFNR